MCLLFIFKNKPKANHRPAEQEVSVAAALPLRPPGRGFPAGASSVVAPICSPALVSEDHHPAGPPECHLNGLLFPEASSAHVLSYLPTQNRTAVELADMNSGPGPHACWFLIWSRLLNLAMVFSDRKWRK